MDDAKQHGIDTSESDNPASQHKKTVNHKRVKLKIWSLILHSKISRVGGLEFLSSNLPFFFLHFGITYEPSS